MPAADRPRLQRPAREFAVTAVGWADWLLLALFITYLFVFAVHRSRTHRLWPDEVLGFRVLAAPTWSGTLRGWYEGADGGGVFYYILGRLWTAVFGFSDLTLRLFSTAGMAAAVVLTWLAARRYASVPVVMASTCLICLFPIEFLWQAADGRFYGLFLASFSCAVLLFLRAVERQPATRDLIFTAGAHALLVGSHILGIVYSFCLVAGLLTSGKQGSRLRLAGSAACGWILLPLSWHAIRASTAIATHRFWTTRPGIGDLLTSFTSSSNLATGVLALLLVLYEIRRSPLASRFRLANALPLPHGVLVVCLSVFSAVLLLFLKSRVRVPVFAERYLLPAALTGVLLCACLLMRLLPRALAAERGPVVTLAASLVLFLPCSVAAFNSDRNEGLYPPGAFLDAAAALPRDTPVLATQFPAFSVLSRYYPERRYLYLLDWPYDLAHNPPDADFSAEHLMENVQRARLDAGNVLPCHEIFARFPDLILLTEPRRMPWLRDRLLHNPNYAVRPLPPLPSWEDASMWSVHRLSPAPLPC